MLYNPLQTNDLPVLFCNVTKQYRKITAVRNVSLQIETGQFFGLIGPNGAGKSTLVKMLMGFIFPTSGNISIFGTSANKSYARKKIGFLSEDHRIPPELSGLEYLRRHCGLMDYSSSDYDKEIDRVLGITGMLGKAHRKAGTYSKGMAQRIGLASAMLFSPEILILDEPTNGLDPIGIRDFRIILEGLKDKKTTVLLNSHLLSEVEKTCDTFAIIINGTIVVHGNKNNISLQGETLEETFIRYAESTN